MLVMLIFAASIASYRVLSEAVAGSFQPDFIRLDRRLAEDEVQTGHDQALRDGFAAFIRDNRPIARPVINKSDHHAIDAVRSVDRVDDAVADGQAHGFFQIAGQNDRIGHADHDVQIFVEMIAVKIVPRPGRIAEIIKDQ